VVRLRAVPLPLTPMVMSRWGVAMIVARGVTRFAIIVVDSAEVRMDREGVTSGSSTVDVYTD